MSYFRCINETATFRFSLCGTGCKWLLFTASFYIYVFSSQQYVSFISTEHTHFCIQVLHDALISASVVVIRNLKHTASNIQNKHDIIFNFSIIEKNNFNGLLAVYRKAQTKRFSSSFRFHQRICMYTYINSNNFVYHNL